LSNDFIAAKLQGIREKEIGQKAEPELSDRLYWLC